MGKNIHVVRATAEHGKFAEQVSRLIYEASKDSTAGIAQRSSDYILRKINESKAVIAFVNNEIAGFCYIESWGHEKFVANSGLIVAPKFRGLGIAKRIKEEAFKLSRELYPEAKLFGLTTSEAVMKINSDLGYRPVSYLKITDDDAFWKGCETCINYDILTRMQRKICLCTGMIFDPNEKKQ